MLQSFIEMLLPALGLFRRQDPADLAAKAFHNHFHPGTDLMVQVYKFLHVPV